MRLRWILIPLGVLVIVGAVVAYFAVIPPTLADDYEEKAEPEQTKVEDALRPVTESFNVSTFGVSRLSTKLSPREYLKRYRKDAARTRRRLVRARTTPRRALRVVKRADADAMTEPPSWPLLGGSGDLGEAEELGGRIDDYLRKVRAFLRGYQRLLEYTATTYAGFARVNIAYAESQAALPRTYTSTRQVTGPLGDALRVQVTELKRLRRLDPPRDPVVRAIHRDDIADAEAAVAGERALIAAYERDDVQRANAILRRGERTTKAQDREAVKQLQRLMDRSRYRRQIEDLERRDDEIFQAFEEL